LHGEKGKEERKEKKGGRQLDEVESQGSEDIKARMRRR
jgi:hypothetical protein